MLRLTFSEHAYTYAHYSPIDGGENAQKHIVGQGKVVWDYVSAAGNSQTTSSESIGSWLHLYQALPRAR